MATWAEVLTSEGETALTQSLTSEVSLLDLKVARNKNFIFGCSSISVMQCSST